MKITHATCFPNATRRHSHLFCAHWTPVAAEHRSRTSIWMIRHTETTDTNCVPCWRQVLPKPVATVHDVGSVHTSQCLTDHNIRTVTAVGRTLCTAGTVFHSAAQSVDIQTKTIHVNFLLAVGTDDWLQHVDTVDGRRAVCLQTASPYKVQINIGITDYSQRISPRRWAACRDGDPTAVLMSSHLLQKLSKYVPLLFTASLSFQHNLLGVWTVQRPTERVRPLSGSTWQLTQNYGSSNHILKVLISNLGRDTDYPKRGIS
jgi:hypothetical protein